MNEEQKKPEENKVARREQAVLSFWDERQIFKKSLEKEAPQGEFVFYDGPPFATGLPHYGHILAGTIKDVIPRFKTMQGYRVRRRWGWDCHGLPVENIVEKELGLRAKKDIEAFGIEKFNETARRAVMRFAEDWKKIVPRLGRWVDMENDYRTMDCPYTESVWWAFKTLHEKELVYEGFKSMQICPRCETTLSNFEVSQGYKDITDLSVYAKFKILDSKFPNSYFIAWTTTPWTLPGNAALAVNPAIKYVLVQASNGRYILAGDRVSKLFTSETVKIEREFKGKELVGLSYEPSFDYYVNDEKLKNRENAWKVYSADFVKTDEGTGIVHIAPAFGEDDMEFGKKYNLPFIQHVKMDGTFKPEVKEFAGLPVKPKDDNIAGVEHQQTDILIIKYLAARGLLFAKERITHSYPHCWRCDTPLLNYAASSWFVPVSQFKNKLVKENKKITWVPPEIGEGRFGKWLEGARDWAISRSRFWGAPIPVWKCEQCAENKVIGSIEEIKSNQKKRNEYFVMRHGESDTNTKRILSSRPLEPHHITGNGREQVKKAAEYLQDKNIDYIFISPFTRTRETADIIIEALGVPDTHVFEDKRLEEIKVGIFDGKPIDDYHAFFQKDEERFVKAPLGGEDYNATKSRLGSFLYDVDQRLEGKKILIITHQTPAWLLFAAARALKPTEAVEQRVKEKLFLENAEIKKLDFVPLPHNADYELDLHRPYIDEIGFECAACGRRMRRVPDVFDCWFESGSMPYAEVHYPFENREMFDPSSNLLRSSKGYPSDFIAEGVDQTRGWFYSLLVLSTALFGHAAYKRVVVNGTVLAEDGQKMAKRLQNYPDPMTVVEKYGADALRFYLLSSPVVHGEDLRFSERGVQETLNKVLTRLDNVLSFYLLYANRKVERLEIKVEKENILDQWIVARLEELTEEVTANLEKYELDRASRPIADFVDDLSTWYLRRSRDRFKGDDETDKNAALETTRFVLVELSKLMAPFVPFFAEYVYGSVKGEKESVHLEEWPKGIDSRSTKHDLGIIEKMREVRKIVSLGLEERAKAGMKVRQPLAVLRFKLKDERLKLEENLLLLIRDEVNVKDVVEDQKIKGDVELDTVLTPELKEEGRVREFIRTIQELRKNAGLTISDLAELTVDTGEQGKAFIEKNKILISKVTLLKNITFGSVEGEEVKIEDLGFRLSIKNPTH